MTGDGHADTARLAVFGSIDGLTMFYGITAGLIVAHQGAAAAWHGALGGAAGELIGMSVGQYESDRQAGKKVAVVCGLAGALACLLPAVPYALVSGWVALIPALLISLLVGAVVCWLRPERGLRAVTRTYLVLIGAGLLSGLTGLIR
jgi:VIT1/CCC1 family predicted Fe2+/Mn2+ transporter